MPLVFWAECWLEGGPHPALCGITQSAVCSSTATQSWWRENLPFEDAWPKILSQVLQWTWFGRLGIKMMVQNGNSAYLLNSAIMWASTHLIYEDPTFTEGVMLNQYQGVLPYLTLRSCGHWIWSKWLQLFVVRESSQNFSY